MSILGTIRQRLTGAEELDPVRDGGDQQDKWVRMLPIVQQNTNHLWRFTKG